MVGNSMTQILKNINTMHGHIKLGFFPDVRSLLSILSLNVAAYSNPT
jgi:hypothetical protein